MKTLTDVPWGSWSGVTSGQSASSSKPCHFKLHLRSTPDAPTHTHTQASSRGYVGVHFNSALNASDVARLIECKFTNPSTHPWPLQMMSLSMTKG